jgi:hypothetical protein
MRDYSIAFDCNRRRWWILIIVYASYLCFKDFATALWTSLVFDLLFNFSFSELFYLRMSPNMLAVSIVIDIVLRMAIIVLGASINAFIAYIFDLTFIEGAYGLYFAMVAGFYAWFRFIDTAAPVILLAPPEQPIIADPRANKQRARGGNDEKTKSPSPPPKVDGYMDYVFLVVMLVYTFMFMDKLFFAEPWTYGMYYIYIFSVFCLVIVSDAPVPAKLQGAQATRAMLRWLAPLLFVIVWVLILVISYAVIWKIIKIERKIALNYYFTYIIYIHQRILFI